MLNTTIFSCCLLYFFVFCVNRTFASGYLSYGPDIKASVGEVWPKPLWQDDKGRYFSVDPKNFQLKVKNFNSL